MRSVFLFCRNVCKSLSGTFASSRAHAVGERHIVGDVLSPAEQFVTVGAASLEREVVEEHVSQPDCGQPSGIRNLPGERKLASLAGSNPASPVARRAIGRAEVHGVAAARPIDTGLEVVEGDSLDR